LIKFESLLDFDKLGTGGINAFQLRVCGRWACFLKE